MDGLTLRAEDLGLSDEALARVRQGEPIAITRSGASFARVVVPDTFFEPAATEAERAAICLGSPLPGHDTGLRRAALAASVPLA